MPMGILIKLELHVRASAIHHFLSLINRYYFLLFDEINLLIDR